MNLDEAIRIVDPATRQEALYIYDPEDRNAVENEACHLVVHALREKQNGGWISVKDRLRGGANVKRLSYWNEEYGCWSYHGPSGEAARHLAAYENFMERWNLSDIEEADRIFQRVNALGGTDLMADYRKLGPIDHLQKLVQAEEDGRLMVLPCKVGDTIYVIPSSVKYALNLVNGHEKENRVYKQKVIEIRFFADDYLLTTYDDMYSVLGWFFGDTWFLSNEEAEEALKKRKET